MNRSDSPDWRDPADNNADEPYAGPERRESVVDRRVSTRTDQNLDRRRGPGRRRSDFMRAAEEGEMTPEQFLFIRAIEAYKQANQRPYPTWTEVLEVMRKLGYRKTCPMQVNLSGAEDWTEPADAPAFGPSQQQTETD